jgi:hypothetical protein
MHDRRRRRRLIDIAHDAVTVIARAVARHGPLAAGVADIVAFLGDAGAHEPAVVAGFARLLSAAAAPLALVVGGFAPAPHAERAVFVERWVRALQALEHGGGAVRYVGACAPCGLRRARACRT